MADIDKGLPNTRTELKVPGEEELVDLSVKEEVTEQEPVEVTPEEDGGATINFEPGAINIPGTESHFDNLADILPEDVLEPIGNEQAGNYQDYKSSRKDWEKTYRDGLEHPQYKQAIEFITVVSTAKQIVKGIVATERHTSVEHLKLMV